MVACYFQQSINGVTLYNTSGGGVISAMKFYGCSFGRNLLVGVQTSADSGIGQPYDVSFFSCYFLLNNQFGANFPNGFAQLVHCGFENNWNSGGFASTNYGVHFANFGVMIGCSAGGDNLNTSYLIGGNVGSGHTFSMLGCMQLFSPPGPKLSFLGGASGAQASIISCRGERDYSGSFATQTTEIACTS